MAKRKKKDGAGFTMSALIRQVLMDMNTHSVKEIASHIQQYMCKTISPKDFQGMVKSILDQDKDLEEVSKGYKLKSGISILDMVVDIISTVNTPLLLKSIVKKVAQEQNVPIETVDINLDKNDRFSKILYKERSYYFLSSRKKANAKIYKILKEKNRPLSFIEIYKYLETDYGLCKDNAIFIVRGDTRFKRHPGSRYALSSPKRQVKLKKTIHNVSRAELDRVMRHLEEEDKPLSASELAKTILKRPLQQSNLLVKLARDTRVKRDKELFYFEKKKEEATIPQKVIDRVRGQYFKVKARLVGSQEIHTLDQLLDRIYKVNVSNVEYKFYKELLTEQLSKDEGVIRTPDGWVQVEADPRALWDYSPELTRVNLADPPAVLMTARLSQTEQLFLEEESKEIISEEEQIDTLQHIVTMVELRNGVILIPQIHLPIFPNAPQYYEISLTDETGEKEYLVFVNRKKAVVLGLEALFKSRFKLSGGLIQIRKIPDRSFNYCFSTQPFSTEIKISAHRNTQLKKMAKEDWILHELLISILGNYKKPLSLWRIWVEVNAVRRVSRKDLLATLQDYNCFVRDDRLEGYYSYDKAAGIERASVVAEEKKAAKASKEKAITKKKAAELKKDAEPDKDEVVTPAVKPRMPEKTKKKVKLEPKQKPPRDVPEHVKRLSLMGKRLPKIHSARRMVVKSSKDKPNSHIQAVSVGKISRPGKKYLGKTKKAEVQLALLEVPPTLEKKHEWDATSFVNPEKGQGHTELFQTLEVLKAFINRSPKVRKTDGSIVIWLDQNDIGIYFRIPPENSNCWLAWISENDIKNVEGAKSFLVEDQKLAKNSMQGYWWSTQKFKGPKGNWKDNNILEGVQIVGKILELMDKPRK